MLFYTQPNTAWEPFDFKLIEAYQIMQDETCPSCGQPVWLCRSDDERIEWKTGSTVCYATKALEESRWNRENSGKKKSQQSPRDAKNWGLSEYPVAFSPDNRGGVLPNRRDYFERLRMVN